MKETNFFFLDVIDEFIGMNEKLYSLLRKYSKIFIVWLVFTTAFDFFVTVCFSPNLSFEGNFFVINTLKYSHSVLAGYGILLVIDLFPVVLASLILTEKGKAIKILGTIFSIAICLIPFVHIVGGLSWFITP